jgi:hypothetical protein
MSTAAELLAGTSASTDTDSWTEENTFVISEDLRTIAIPEGQVILGVESDDKVRRIWFDMPAFCDGLELSTFKAWVNYRNAANVLDRYEVDDMISAGGRIRFSWLVGRSAFASHGTVLFNVCLRKYAQDQTTVLAEFNTTLGSMIVLEGLEADPLDEETYTDAWNSFMAGATAQLTASTSAADAAAARAGSIATTVETSYQAAEQARDDAYQEAEAGRDAASANQFTIRDGAYCITYEEE